MSDGDNRLILYQAALICYTDQQESEMNTNNTNTNTNTNNNSSNNNNKKQPLKQWRRLTQAKIIGKAKLITRRTRSSDRALSRASSKDRMLAKNTPKDKILAKTNSKEKLMAWRRTSRTSSRSNSIDSVKALAIDSKRGSSGSIKSNASYHSSSEVEDSPNSSKKTSTTNTTTTTTSNNSRGSVSEHPKEIHEEEFMIAADLTLYANPLRVLNKAGRSAAKHDTSGTGSDMIAADLVKYGSPLDDKP